MGEDQAPEFVLQKCYQTLALSLHKVVDHIVGCAGHVSLREGSNDFLLCSGNRKIVERRWIPDNLRDIVDHKLHFVSLAKLHLLERSGEEGLRHRLLPKLHP